MDDFYGNHVHHDIITHYDDNFSKYYNRITAELKLLNINLNTLQGARVIDVGTGMQSLVFEKLNCKEVFHFDISSVQIESFNEYLKTNNIKNILSLQADILDPLFSFPKYDFAFIYGVLHHLPNPSILISNLLSSADKNSKIMFRCYRSGTWSRWLVHKIRDLNHLISIEKLRNTFGIVFPLEDNKQFINDMIDDVFVSQWGAFHPAQFRKDAEMLNLSYYSPDNEFDLDFNHYDENFRVVFGANEHSTSIINSKDLKISSPINQGALHSEIYNMSQLNHVWDSYVNKISSLSEMEVCIRVISLYRLTRKMNSNDYYYSKYNTSSFTHSSEIGESRIKNFMKILSQT